MKKMLIKFADSLLSKQELKTIKGGEGYCPGGSYNQNYACRINNYIEGYVWTCCQNADAACKRQYGQFASASC